MVPSVALARPSWRRLLSWPEPPGGSGQETRGGDPRPDSRFRAGLPVTPDCDPAGLLRTPDRRTGVELAWNPAGSCGPGAWWSEARVGVMLQLNGRDVTTAELGSLAFTNYGHFTSMRVQRGAVPGLGLHLDRLRHDCAALFDTDLDLGAVRAQLRQAVAGIEGPLIVRVTVFDPGLELAHPGADATPQILISGRPAAGAVLPLRLSSARYTRDLPGVKHVGLFATMQARRVAQRGGTDDVVFVEPDGTVTEGATWNIGFLDGDRVVWPEAEVLPGVTMRLLDGLLDRAGTPARTQPLTVEAIGGLTAAFATNVSVGVRPISSIDGHHFDDAHPVLGALRENYFALPPEPI